MEINGTKSLTETKLEKGKTDIKDAETTILLTVYMGLFLGMVPVVGLPIIVGEMAAKIMLTGILLAVASFGTSFFLGTLFGIPRPVNNPTAPLSLSNSLGEIADWLSKILVGLLLVNLKEVPDLLMNLANYVTASSQYKGQLVNIYAICILFYFVSLGIYIGYNYMRLVLSHKYQYADDSIIKKQLEKAEEEINLKDKKLIQSQGSIQEKEQLTKSLLSKINQLCLPQTDHKALEKAISKTKDQSDNCRKMIDKAKLKLHKGLIVHPADPQKGQWNAKSKNQQRELKANVTEESKGLYKIELEILSTDPQNNPLKKGAYVLLALHDSFGNPPFQLLKIEQEQLKISFYTYGSFTIGAFVEQIEIELELDLSEIAGLSSHFKNH